MVAELTPGTQEAGELRGGRADPDRPDAARRQPRRDPRRARRRHAHATCSCCSPTAREALERQRARAGEHDPPLRADSRATRAQIAEQLAQRRDEHQARRSTTSRSSSRSSAARTTSWPSSSRTPTRSSPRSPSQDANLRATLQELPVDADRDADARWARPSCSPTSSGRRCRRCARAPARSARRCVQTRPFLRETTPIIRDEIRPFVRASRPPVDASCARRCATSRRSTPDLVRDVQDRQRAAQHAGLQPARRHARRASCSGPRGSTTSARRSSPTRTRRARSAAASS